MFDPTRPCSSHSKKKDRYTKSELEGLIQKYYISLPYSNMTITEICNYFKTLNWNLLEKKRVAEKEKMKQWYKKKKAIMEEKRKKDLEIKKAKMIEMKKLKQRKDKEQKEKKQKQLEKKKLQEKSKKNCIERSKKELRDYQRRVVSYFGRNDRLLVYHKMGTGKTLTAVTVSQCYLDANPNRKVIVITPASLIDNFKKAMMLEYENIRNDSRYEFCSIQKATRLLKENKLYCKNNLVILDEAHNYKAKVEFKNGKLKSGVNIFEGYKCFLKARKLLLLTGTPVYNRPEDLTIYKVLLNFDKNLMKEKSTEEIIKHYEKFDLDSLRCKVSYHDFSKSDKDFPKRVDIIKKLPMRHLYEDRYKKILEEIKELKLQGGGDTKLLGTVFKKLSDANKNQFENLTRRLTQNIDNNLELNAKLDYVIKIIRKIEKENTSLSDNQKYKMVIYSQFKEHGIHLLMEKTKIPFGVITGDTKVSQRQKIVNDYNAGKLCILYITKAAGEGLDLKGTDAIFLMEPTWNENNSEQIIARAIRYKSHENRSPTRRKVRVYHLIHTYSEDMKEPIQKRVDVYLKDSKSIVPAMPTFLDGEDYKMLIYQNAKQKVLKYWENRLQELSIEKNKCLP